MHYLIQEFVYRKEKTVKSSTSSHPTSGTPVKVEIASNPDDILKIKKSELDSSFFGKIKRFYKTQPKSFFAIVFGSLFLLFLTRIPTGMKLSFTPVNGIPVPTPLLQAIDSVSLLWSPLLFVLFVFLLFFYLFPNEKSLAIGLAIITIFVFMSIFADFIAPYSPIVRNDNCLSLYPSCSKAPPSPEHIMGSTTLGYDVYSRIIYGAQIPLQISIITAGICFFIGVPMGIISGFFGGYLDRIPNAVMDVIYSFPALLLAITLSLFLVNIPFIGGADDLRIILIVSFSNGLIYIPTMFRITRGKVLQIKNQPYIEAIHTLGGSKFLIMFRYILPNVIAAPITIIPFAITDAILTEAALAFLGIGITAPTPDWGYDLTDARSLTETQPWLIIFPGLMIFFLAFAFSLIGDALNDKFNPYIQNNSS
jgi:peptide/nickel transport system permease protein